MITTTVGPANQPGTSIVLHPPGADPGITDDERRTIAEMMAKGTYRMIVFATNDLDGAFELNARRPPVGLRPRRARRVAGDTEAARANGWRR